MTSRSGCTRPATEAATPVPAADQASAQLLGETLRRARQYHGWSLREVERRTGRPNAYLSQVERGIIRRPDPVVLWHLADLYELNFDLLLQWAEHEVTSDGNAPVDSVTAALIKSILSLTPDQRVRALSLLEHLAHEERS